MFQWKDKFSIDMDKIDEQHQELFSIGTELYTLISKNTGMDQYDEIIKVVFKLGEYTVYHFEYEENLMKENGYPELQRHKIQHDTFTEKIKSVSIDDEDGEQKKVIMDLIVFISDWIGRHILESDMKYKEFLDGKEAY